MPIAKELVAASAAPIVLSILSYGENYGYAIIKRVAELSGGKMKWADGMLYPVLRRLESQGLIESRIVVAESGRERKYYCIKEEGKRVLKEQRSQWMTVYETLKQLCETQPCMT